MNPNIYKPDDINNITKFTAQEKWDFDENKIKLAKEKGFKQLMITCSPDNIASRKIIESLPFKYLETKEVPACLKKDFDQGDYIKRIYCLDLEEL